MWLIFVFFAVFTAQIWLGVVGVQHHLGPWWAIGALIAAFGFRIMLPLTIGTYFGAVDVMGWEWYIGVIIAAPGLLFVVPALVTSMLEELPPLRETFKGKGELIRKIISGLLVGFLTLTCMIFLPPMVREIAYAVFLEPPVTVDNSAALVIALFQAISWAVIGVVGFIWIKAIFQNDEEGGEVNTKLAVQKIQSTTHFGDMETVPEGSDGFLTKIMKAVCNLIVNVLMALIFLGVLGIIVKLFV